MMTLRIAFKALGRNKLRTALTMLGMIIGVAAVIAMVAMGTGASAQIEEQIKSAPGKGKNVILLAHVVFHEAKNPDQDWYIKEGREGFSKLLSTYQDRIYAMFSGHHHIGLRGWGDNFGIHEVIIPAVSWNKLRGSEVNGGYNLPEERRGWVQAFVTAEKVVLKYKPLNAEVKESKELQTALALK